jgi:Gp5 N-terminal OB domain
MENFIGKDGFVWWVGVIENRADPLGLGRCKVRIFGWHTDNISELPTDDLPWATPMLPINNSKSFSTPRLGDWVVGFFLDVASAQSPVMMGVLPGIQP